MIAVPVLLGFLLPALAARQDLAAPAAGRMRLLRRLKLVGGASAAALVLLAVAGLAAGTAPGGLAVAAVYGIGVALVLFVAYESFRNLRANPVLAQVLAAVLWALLLGTVYYANPIVEAAPDRETRHLWTTLLVGANPPLMLAHHALDVDLLRRPLLYSVVSVIPEFGYRYPGWFDALMVQWVGAFLAWAATWGIGRWVPSSTFHVPSSG